MEKFSSCTECLSVEWSTSFIFARWRQRRKGLFYLKMEASLITEFLSVKLNFPPYASRSTTNGVLLVELSSEDEGLEDHWVGSISIHLIARGNCLALSTSVFKSAVKFVWTIAPSEMPRVSARTEDSMNCTNSISYAHHVEYIEPSLFDLIPEELGRLLLQYLDIPSLSVLSILSRSSRISLLASDDVTWLGLVHQRFKIISSPVKGRLIPLKAKTYGGPSWKTAYRSMSICNRMPRNKIV